MKTLYIYIKPIKSNCFSHHSLPLDLAEMKSWPFKLHFITANIAVHGSFLASAFFYPCFPRITLPPKLDRGFNAVADG
ncbi:hypothetical protein Hanom_Chr01g00078321 [Helianthus anomalus]